MTVTLRYFAWVRERAGLAQEQIELPAGLVTVADVIGWLQTRGPEYANAFAKPEVIRVALDMRHVKATAPIAGAAEIAFFPPVTGG